MQRSTPETPTLTFSKGRCRSVARPRLHSRRKLPIILVGLAGAGVRPITAAGRVCVSVQHVHPQPTGTCAEARESTLYPSPNVSGDVVVNDHSCCVCHARSRTRILGRAVNLVVGARSCAMCSRLPCMYHSEDGAARAMRSTCCCSPQFQFNHHAAQGRSQEPSNQHQHDRARALAAWHTFP